MSAAPHPGAVGAPSTPAPAVQQWLVGAEYAGQRIDNFLLARLKGVPKTRIYRMLRTGEVRVNGGRVGSDYRVQEDDRLRIPPIRVAANAPEGGDLRSAASRVSPSMARSVADKIGVVMEDEVMLAIDKPFGLAVHGGSGVKLGVIEALRASGDRDDAYLELVHRLDRETSGLMLLAKRRSSLTEFHRQLREGEMRKRYLALVWGGWPADVVRIEAPLHKWVNAKGERWVRVQAGGQAAITKVKVLQHLHHNALGELSLLQCEPLTGRTHQLRVHLASVGHPIVGDPKYGLHERDAQHGPKGTRRVARMYLHAWMLRLKHPASGETLHLKATLEACFQAMLQLLGARAL
ncbi:MAG: RluA family pseudouridine synthase [Burkholderiaceae bacterium]|nr:RluA family pseudouridine synthase [Burkholderiaceae bacterium]